MNFSNFLYLTPVLFGLYFILIRYAQNLNEVSDYDLIFILSIFLPLIAAFAFISKIILKNSIKSSLISSLAIILFFTYVPIYDLIFDSENIDSSSQVILLSSLIIFLFLVIYALIKSKKNYENVLKISFAISLTLILFNIMEIGYYSNSDKLFVDNSVETFSVNSETLRDVYYITLDAHASTPALKKYFNYDNSHFNNFLKEREFFIPEISFSNYLATKLSMPSILNMDYIYLESTSEKEQDLILRQMMIDNAVVKNFKNIGYEIVSFDNEYNYEPSSEPHNVCDGNLRSLRLLTFVISTTPYVVFKNMLISTLDKTTVDDGAGNVSFQPMIENRKCVLDALSNVSDDFSHPMFVHAHLMLPHGPYFFDSIGNIVNARNLSDEEIPSAYLSQLQYTDLRIMNSIDQLLEIEPKPIIIIQSDHGFRFPIGVNDTNLYHGYSNFAAYYFPDKELNENEFSKMTPVNTFRILFNTYFGTNYDILEHKAFQRDNSTFNDVTEIVISNNISK